MYTGPTPPSTGKMGVLSFQRNGSRCTSSVTRSRHNEFHEKQKGRVARDDLSVRVTSRVLSGITLRGVPDAACTLPTHGTGRRLRGDNRERLDGRNVFSQYPRPENRIRHAPMTALKGGGASFQASVWPSPVPTGAIQASSSEFEGTLVLRNCPGERAALTRAGT